MNFADETIIFKEIPNEITLAYTITGCNLKCKGCHSAYLWNKNNGTLLTKEHFTSTLSRYRGYISCVLFLGGEWDSELLNFLLITRQHNLKTALYTGEDIASISTNIKEQLTYLKYGKWIKELGGLQSSTTNQRLVDLTTNEVLNHYFQ